MDSAIMGLALLIAVLTLGLGFLVFRSLFDLATLQPKPRRSETGVRVKRWFRAHGKKVLLAVLLLAAVLVLTVAGIRLGPAAFGAARGLLERRAAASAAARQPEAPPPAEQPAPPPEEPAGPAAIVADHRGAAEVRLDRIPAEVLQRAAAGLRILFVHGTHGAQITYGLKALPAFKGPVYAPPPIEAIEFPDRSDADVAGWIERARAYLDDPDHRGVNVVMWLWSDELSTAAEQEVADYLALTAAMEEEFPRVRFVYTTGHLDGSGPAGNLRQRNDQIRAFCRENAKALYDFADIESWDPDGVYYGDRPVNDGCWYDSDGDGSLDRNWAKEWSEANPGAWYDCYSPHTFPLNANLKAYAAWWLWAALAAEGLSDKAD